MIFKKKEFFLLIFLIFLQSCSGGRIGNFLESSFNDLEKISKDEVLQSNLVNKKNVFKENKEFNDKKNKKIKKVEKPENFIENKKDMNSEKIPKQKNIKIKKDMNSEKIPKQKNIKIKKDMDSEKIPKQKNIKIKKDMNSEKIPKQKKIKIKNSTKKRSIDLQSYKIIFILKDVDPKDPTEELSTILSNSEVNFEIEKIERILDSKNKRMNKN